MRKAVDALLVSWNWRWILITSSVLVLTLTSAAHAQETGQLDQPFPRPEYLIHDTYHSTTNGPVTDNQYILYVLEPDAQGNFVEADGFGGVYHYASDFHTGPLATPRAVCQAAASRGLAPQPWTSYDGQSFDCRVLFATPTPATPAQQQPAQTPAQVEPAPESRLPAPPVQPPPAAVQPSPPEAPASPQPQESAPPPSPTPETTATPETTPTPEASPTAAPTLPAIGVAPEGAGSSSPNPGNSPLPWIAGIGIGGAAAAGGLALARALRNRGASSTSPCADEQGRMVKASANARALNNALQTLRNLRDALETQRENARESGYFDASIDLAFIAGPYAGGATFATAGAAVAANAVRAMGQEMFKDFERFALDRGVSPEMLIAQGLGVAPAGPDNVPIPGTGGAAQQILQNVMKDFLMARAKRQLIDSGVTVTEQALQNLEQNMAGPLSDVFGAMLGGAGMGLGIMDISRTLAEFDKYISVIRDKTFAAEQAFDDALSEMDLARSALNYCLKLHPEAANQ